MHKQTVTYDDFDGNTHTEDLYFNISRAKIIEMTLTGEAEDLLKDLQSAVQNGSGKDIIRLVRDLIKLSYGEKDVDGKTFRQSEELSNDFLQSQPFDQLFYDMMTEPEKALIFLEALFPAKLMAEAKEKAAAQGLTLEDIALADDPQAFFRPEPQDHKPKQVIRNEINDISVVDVQLTDTPLPGQEFTEISKNAKLEEVKTRQRFEQQTLIKFGGHDFDLQGVPSEDSGYTVQELDFLRSQGLIN